jgi:hypothetical protein
MSEMHWPESDTSDLPVRQIGDAIGAVVIDADRIQAKIQIQSLEGKTGSVQPVRGGTQPT